MEINEFIKANSRLEQYYDKEYSEEQRKIMFDRLKNISVKDYIKAINICLEKCKFLPKIADIKSALAEPNYATQNSQKIEFVKCDKCNNGFVKYYKKIDNNTVPMEYEYIALCTCENGLKQKEINGYKFSFINEVIRN